MLNHTMYEYGINVGIVILLHMFFIDNFAVNGDFDSGLYSMMFTKGAIAATFCVNIRDDRLFELDETFSLVIDAASLPASVVRGNPYTADVTILDNECMYIISAYLLRTQVHCNICCINICERKY